MLINIEIADEHIPSIMQYIQTQAVHKMDDLTGTHVLVAPFETTEEFFLDAVAQTLQGVLNRFPSQTMRTKLTELKRLEAELKQSVKPTIVKGDKND
jgi:hypothetical protein